MVDVPAYIGTIALGLLVLLGGVMLFSKRWVMSMLRLALFMMIPYLVFMAHLQLSQIVSPRLQFSYHLAFGFLAFMAVMTLKFTRRQQGFKANPFDFLIIFTSVIITSIPEIKNAVEDVSLITAKMIALFFAFEVLMGETRGKVYKLSAFMIISLGTLAVKAFIY